jgi:hypothetical protein
MLGRLALLDDHLDEKKEKVFVESFAQRPEQDQAIATVLPGLLKREIHGGRVYVAGTYHSFDFAELVSAQYRALNFFTTVVRLAETPE